MKYFKKLNKRKTKVKVMIPSPVPFFDKPSLPRVVFFKVHPIEFVKESTLSLS